MGGGRGGGGGRMNRDRGYSYTVEAFVSGHHRDYRKLSVIGADLSGE